MSHFHLQLPISHSSSRHRNPVAARTDWTRKPWPPSLDTLLTAALALAPTHSCVVMPLIHNLLLSIQALIARQLRSHFTDKEVEAPGKEAIYQTEHLLIVAEPGKKWGAGTRHPEVLRGPALQGVSQLPGCLTGLPWSLASFSSAGEPGTQTLSCTPPHAPTPVAGAR